MAQAPPTTFTYNGVTYHVDWRLFLTDQGGLTRVDGRPITQEDRVNGGEWFNNVYVASFIGATPEESFHNLATMTPARQSQPITNETFLLLAGGLLLLMLFRR